MKRNLPCTKCDLAEKNSNGLFTCNGCEKDFCLKHITDHKIELENHFEQIVNEFNLVNNLFQEYRQHSNEYAWKRITNLRKDLNEIKLQIDEKQKSANYSEKHFEQWTNKLYQLKYQLINIEQSNSFFEQIINCWTKIDRFLSSPAFRIAFSVILVVVVGFYIADSLKPLPPSSFLTFNYLTGPIVISADGKLAEHIGRDGLAGLIRINTLFDKNVHRIQFSFDQLSSSNTFIGVKTSQSQLIDPLSSPGWWIGDRDVIYNIPQESQIYRWIKKFFNLLVNKRKRSTFRYAIESHDILELELDCIKSIVTLKNHRNNRQYQLDINLDQIPLPWDIFFQLDHHSDRLRLF